MAAADTMMVVSPMGEGGRGHGCGLLHHDRLRPHQHHFKHHRPHPLLLRPPHGSHCPPSCGPPSPKRHHHRGHSHRRHLMAPPVMGGELIGLDDQDPVMAPHHHQHPGPPPFAGFLGPHFHHPGHHFHHRRHGRVNPDAHAGGVGPMVADCSSPGSEEEDFLQPEPRNTDAYPPPGAAIAENFFQNFPPPPPSPLQMMMMHRGHGGRFLHSGELPLHLGVSETPHDLVAGLLRGANCSDHDGDFEKALRIRLLRHGGHRMRRHGGRRCSSVPHDGGAHGCHPHPDAAVRMRGHSGERGSLATTSAPINNVEVPNPVTATEGVEDANDALALMALNDTTNTDVNPSH